jgi:hypothetical protein
LVKDLNDTEARNECAGEASSSLTDRSKLDACMGRCPIRIIQCSKVGVHRVQMSLPGRCVIACTLVRNYGVTYVAPI